MLLRAAVLLVVAVVAATCTFSLHTGVTGSALMVIMAGAQELSPPLPAATHDVDAWPETSAGITRFRDIQRPIVGWVGPTTIREQDRVAFLRGRKVGSSHFLSVIHQSGWCEVALGEHCWSGQCLYNTHTNCRETPSRNKCGVECPHTLLPRIKTLFSMQQKELYDTRQLLTLDEMGSMHVVAVMRNPVDRFLSYMFYVRWACKYVGKEDTIPMDGNPVPMTWLTNLPDEQQEHICGGNVHGLLPLTAANNDIAKTINGVGWDTRNITEDECKDAIHHFLTDVELVLLSEDMDAGMKLFEMTFQPTTRVRPPPLNTRNSKAPFSRTTPVDPLREQLLNDAEVRQAIEKHNWCDVELYKLARVRYRRQLKEAGLL